MSDASWNPEFVAKRRGVRLPGKRPSSAMPKIETANSYYLVSPDRREKKPPRPPSPAFSEYRSESSAT